MATVFHRVFVFCYFVNRFSLSLLDFPLPGHVSYRISSSNDCVPIRYWKGYFTNTNSFLEPMSLSGRYLEHLLQRVFLSDSEYLGEDREGKYSQI